MAGKRDFYEVLGVDRNASPDQIKSAFRKLVLKWHPDKWVNASEEEKKTAADKFKEASEAYSVLSDPDKKARYDRFGEAGLGGDAGGSGFGGFGDFNINDVLRDLFGGAFGGFGGFVQQHSLVAGAGEDIERVGVDHGEGAGTEGTGQGQGGKGPLAGTLR